MKIKSICRNERLHSYGGERLLEVNDIDAAVVVLPHSSEDDPQKRKSYAWKAVELVTVGVYM